MFPPVVLSLFCLVLFLLCLPLGKLPLSFLTLEKRLYLREQDTGQSLHFMVGYPGAIVMEIVSDTCRFMPIKAILPLWASQEYLNNAKVRIHCQSGNQMKTAVV